jgi:hypothetical protein
VLWVKLIDLSLCQLVQQECDGNLELRLVFSRARSTHFFLTDSHRFLLTIVSLIKLIYFLCIHKVRYFTENSVNIVKNKNNLTDIARV